MTERPPLPQSSLTDSPWFWAMIFCAFGVVLLLAISPKYARRQGRIELQYQAHEDRLRRESAAPGDSPPKEKEPTAPPPTGELIIPIWPLMSLLFAMCLASSAMLWRSRRKQLEQARRGWDGIAS